MPDNAEEVDILVVGAGIAGLMAARRVCAAGLKIAVVEADERVGGRLATRRIGKGMADSGAQFFTVRSDEFRVEIDSWIAEALVFEWSRGWSGGSGTTGASDGYPRYVARGGFGSLARHLAAGLDARLATPLEFVTWDGSGWNGFSSTGKEWRARGIILTPPVPLSLTLLDRGEVQLSDEGRAALTGIRFAKCLSGLFEIDGEIDLPEPGALQRPEEPISWIADNHRKGVAPEATTITVHAGPKASDDHWVMDDGSVLSWMIKEIRPLLRANTVVKSARLDRWPHAIPEKCYSERCFFESIAGPLAIAGDAFNGPRIEGAALSGMAAADSILQRW